MGNGRLAARIERVAGLRDETVREMWTLFERYYADVRPEQFRADLAVKDHVLLLRDSASGALGGFTTLESYERRFRGRRVRVVFSGDTIVDRRHWGDKALHWGFFRYVAWQKLRHPARPLYWLLISKGYRTYLLLARNFPEHWPRHDRDTPAWQAGLLDSLARERWKEAWLPEDGVLRFERCLGRLRPEVAPVDERAARAPDVRFFLERNPGARRGDELCCLGRVDARLAVHFSTRRLRATLRGRGGPRKSS